MAKGSNIQQSSALPNTRFNEADDVSTLTQLLHRAHRACMHSKEITLRENIICHRTAILQHSARTSNGTRPSG